MTTQNTNEPQQVNQVKDRKYYHQLLKDLRKEFEIIKKDNQEFLRVSNNN